MSGRLLQVLAHRGRRHGVVGFAALCALFAPAGATGFSLLGFFSVPCTGPCPPETALLATFEEAPRWPAELGVGGVPEIRIPVGVAPSFVEALGADTPELRDLMDQAVLASFAAWETEALRFDVVLDDPDYLRAGIVVEAVDSDHWAFRGTTLTGSAFVSRRFDDRVLTHGPELPGFTIFGAQVFLNLTIFDGLFEILQANLELPDAERARLLQHFLMHEIGHAIGLDHPNQAVALFANFDDDDDPFTRVAPDPRDPFAGLAVSQNTDPNAIMLGGAPGNAAWFLVTELQPDDLSGRDVLYPAFVPEPGGALASAGATLALMLLATLSSRRPPSRTRAAFVKALAAGRDREGPSGAVGPSPMQAGAALCTRSQGSRCK